MQLISQLVPVPVPPVRTPSLSFTAKASGAAGRVGNQSRIVKNSGRIDCLEYVPYYCLKTNFALALHGLPSCTYKRGSDPETTWQSIDLEVTGCTEYRVQIRWVVPFWVGRYSRQVLWY